MYPIDFFLLLSAEILMDSTTATAELGWTIYPSLGVSCIGMRAGIMHTIDQM